MQRRQLLQALAALGVASTPAVDALDTIRDGVDRAVGRDEDSHLEEWEETVAEYGYSYVELPPHRLFPDLAADLVLAQRAMARHQRSRQVTSWYRVMSALAMLTAKTLCNMGESRQARPWWATAQQAANKSGDVSLSLWVSAEELIHGMYDRRPTVVLLHRAEAIAAHAPASASRGLAPVGTAHAQLLALDGRRDAALRKLQRCAEVFEHLPVTVTGDVRTVAGWGEDRLRYTEAFVYAHLGERDPLDQAVARTQELLAPAGDHRARAQISLLQAFGHVRTGDVTEGVRLAQTVYESQPAEQRAEFVQSLAEQVLEAVPTRNSGDRLVADYRQLLHQSREARAIT
ncbi:hypothetical protein [Thermomonospora umbrina]|nr:hypothetical protein [Thermomonospora umbrina]